jgi:DNA invertase Pin-like site-specific DNA recombinase
MTIQQSSKARCAIYARCSTILNQDPMNQLVALRRIAEARGLEIYNEYVDHGISGSKGKEARPALNQMVEDAKAKKFDHLLVYSIDRLSRNVRNFLNLMFELKGFNVNLISIREQMDLESPIGIATLTILGAVAELEKNQISERIKIALASKKFMAQKNQTDWKCGRPIKITNEIHQQIVELRNSGKSVRGISKILNISKSSVERVFRREASKTYLKSSSTQKSEAHSNSLDFEDNQNDLSRTDLTMSRK